MSMALKYGMKKRAKKMAEGGAVGGAETSTTGNKTKTGGSNPGGASTGGAGTVTITTGKNPPRNISVSDIGGRTAARNAGGMDPSDEDDEMMMALGGDTGPNANPDVVEPDEPDEPDASDLDDMAAARGGEVENHKALMTDDLVDRIMMKRAKKMSKGGMVANGGDDDLDQMADGKPNNFDDLALRDHLESDYDGDNAGDHLGNAQEDHDRSDIVARIMRSRAKKDRMPRPA